MKSLISKKGHQRFSKAKKGGGTKKRGGAPGEWGAEFEERGKGAGRGSLACIIEGEKRRGR